MARSSPAAKGGPHRRERGRDTFGRDGGISPGNGAEDKNGW